MAPGLLSLNTQQKLSNVGSSQTYVVSKGNVFLLEWGVTKAAQTND